MEAGESQSEKSVLEVRFPLLRDKLKKENFIQKGFERGSAPFKHSLPPDFIGGIKGDRVTKTSQL